MSNKKENWRENGVYEMNSQHIFICFSMKYTLIVISRYIYFEMYIRFTYTYIYIYDPLIHAIHTEWKKTVGLGLLEIWLYSHSANNSQRTFVVVGLVCGSGFRMQIINYSNILCLVFAVLKATLI